MCMLEQRIKVLLDNLSLEVQEMYLVTWNTGDTLRVLVKRKNKDARIKELTEQRTLYYSKPFSVEKIEYIETIKTFISSLLEKTRVNS